ncbi:hypothetical protein CVT24_012169 [Panaeolus cyanescens]|uniref:Extracellular membrane protein CFEM domain-containing protein n=1 Tax=Panaeolus cyanescens TaxID=181874 RepID=A0A409YIS7_9AGAR|nr:hypothetical protein CVT24_012169 [Panaeolus cyanescens]
MKLNIIAFAATLLATSTTASTLTARSPGWWSEMPECGLNSLFESAEMVGCQLWDLDCMCKTLRRFQLVFEERIVKVKCTRSDYELALKVIYNVPCAVNTIGHGLIPTATAAAVRVEL